MGNVQDRYIHYSPEGDQKMGRCVAGLSPAAGEFSILPPHFDDETRKLFLMDLEKILPGAQNFPTGLGLGIHCPFYWLHWFIIGIG